MFLSAIPPPELSSALDPKTIEVHWEAREGRLGVLVRNFSLEDKEGGNME